MTHVQTCILVFAVMLITLVGGCSSKYIVTEPVEGIVTMDGEPLEGCSITLYPVEEGMGEPSYAYTDAKGYYRVGTFKGRIDAGTTPGEYIVGFSKWVQVPTGRKVRDDDGSMVDQMREVNLVHRNYESKERSPWKVTVVKGKNRFDFALKSDGSGATQ